MPGVGEWASRMLTEGAGTRDTTPTTPRAGVQPSTEHGLPDTWRDRIVSAVIGAVGEAQIFLIGSRATGEAVASSDCDISVVVPSHKILTAARRLQAVGPALSGEFGVPVSVNPIPKLLFERVNHNLYILKVRAEGIRLDDRAGDGDDVAAAAQAAGTGSHRPGGEWVSDSSRARCAEVSYLLSAVHTLLQGVQPRILPTGSLDDRAEAALRKAKAQTAQSLLLARGQYVSTARTAVTMAEQLGLIEEELSGLEGVLRLRQRLLRILGPVPVRRSGVRAVARDLQYVALSTLRGHDRWRVLRHHRGIEACLAAASLRLLESLSPDHPDGCDWALVVKAARLLPADLRPLTEEYGALRDVIISEWASAQPLIGVVL